MSVAKITEISSSSTVSFEDAVQKGVAKAAKTIHGIKSAWIKDYKVEIAGGKVTEFRVKMRLTFLLDE